MDFNLIGFDYTNLLHKKVAIDAETKALLTKEIGNVYVLKTGDTMTGLLILSGDPTDDLHAATKKYVDDNVGNGGTLGFTLAADYPGANIGEKVNNALADDKKNIIMPAGELTIGSGDEIFIDDSNIRLFGMGRNITRITYEGGSAAIRLKTCKRNELRGFTLLGNSNGHTGLCLEDTWHGHFQNIGIEGFTNVGLYFITADNNWGSYYNLFEEVESNGAKSNCWLGKPGANGVAVNANTFVACKFRTSNHGSDSRNIYLEGHANENVFILPECSVSEGIGIDIYSVRNVFINAYVESCNIGIKNSAAENILLGAILNGNIQDFRLDVDFKFIIAQGFVPRFGETLTHKGSILYAGTQTEGRCSCYMRDASVAYPENDVAYAYTDFREKLTNTPSSITLSNAGETENYSIKSSSVGHITVFGFDFYITSTGGGDVFACGSKKYVTVGN